MKNKDINEYFRILHNLSESWEIYSWECIPKNEYTHIKLTGCETTVFKKGKQKGDKKYTGEMKRSFIFSNEEYEVLKQKIAESHKSLA
jgi:hypothetical protein